MKMIEHHNIYIIFLSHYPTGFQKDTHAKKFIHLLINAINIKL